ncbi:hypothetical protein [Marinactinospora rubrisoli]|uniref:Uncharacterized protein n=1 Tax=Marinactinospora rubrisoli TaxID=2715399 RepID=A0ABW2KCE6_9ACTN
MSGGEASAGDRDERDRRLVVERLEAAGWEMAVGAVTLSRAALTYPRGRMVLEIERHHERPELLFNLVDPRGGELTVFPVYGDRLADTLDAIVGFQDRIGPDDYREVLRELVAACPEVYVQADEDDEPRLLIP